LAIWNLGICLVGKGRHAEAVSALELPSDKGSEGASLMLGILAWTKAVAGRTEDALRHVEELRDWMKHRHVPRYTLAWTFGALGDIEGALHEYERSVDELDAFLMYPLFPGYDPIRTEPRFQKGLERLGLGWAIGR
jgi:hypothetical protein